MSIEATIMVECRIVDAEPTQAHLLREGQPVVFGGKVHHVDDAQFTDARRYVKVRLKHYDKFGMSSTQTITVAKDSPFECLQIVQIRGLK